jgi:predicted metal-dependent peptidase
MEVKEHHSKAAQIARDILGLSRNTLLIHLRFLDEALFRLRPVQMPPPQTFATDGESLFYSVSRVFERFKEEKSGVTRDYLHLVLHCVYRHAFVGRQVDSRLWDLAVDMAVEGNINSLGLSVVGSVREFKQQQVLSDIKAKVRVLTAEKIYNHLKDPGLPEKQLREWAALFYADDHSLWYQKEEPSALAVEQKKTQHPQEDDQGGAGPFPEQMERRESEGEGRSNQGDGDSLLAEALAREKLRQEWEDISRRMQTDLETASKVQGSQAGDLTQQLQQLNRERYDYSAFLRKFAVMGEAMKINDDEFDYVFYTYGLRLYGNLPLVEPLEYKEVKRIREFVIAIDTSGSTSGELVQTFLQKTYNILLSTESFFSRINLRIIQCDAQIQESVKITSQEEFEQYLKNLKIRGLGGTDFRPVFTHVQELIGQKEFSNLKGLIYFTDGYGTFPEKKPPYETAFVFIKDIFSDVQVPPWAIKLVLEKEEMQG